MADRRKTICLRLHIETHQRLRHVKHELEKETFDEAVTVLLDEHEAKKRGEGSM